MVASLLFWMVLYLLLCLGGACVFYLFERPVELANKVVFEEHAAKFKLLHAKLAGLQVAGTLNAADMATLDRAAPMAVSLTEFDDWNFWGSFFFSTTIVTTVGYGSFAPQTIEGKVFLIFYSLVGICVAGQVFGVIGNRLIAFLRRCFHCREPTPVIDASDMKLKFQEFDLDNSGTLSTVSLFFYTRHEPSDLCSPLLYPDRDHGGS
jgi:hypothetical protein